MRVRGGSRVAGALRGTLALVVLLAGCGGIRRSDVGSTEVCPNRDAYCPAEGPGVAWPGQPADSPSGLLRLRVLPVSSADAGEDWRFEVVDKATGAVVLTSPSALDGGLGLVVAWDQAPEDAVWVTRPRVARWRPGSDQAAWVKEEPAAGAVLPPVVAETLASDRD